MRVSGLGRSRGVAGNVGRVNDKTPRRKARPGSAGARRRDANDDKRGRIEPGAARRSRSETRGAARVRPTAAQNGRGEASSLRGTRATQTSRDKAPRPRKPLRGVTGGASSRRGVPRNVASRRRGTRRTTQIRVGIMAVVLAVLLVATYFGFHAIKSNIKQNTAAPTMVPTDLYKPVACTPETLQVSMNSRGGVSGRPVKINVELRNVSTENPCFVDVGYANMGVNITSGSAQISNLAACELTTETKRLLIDRGEVAKQTVQWNGGVAASGCGSTNHMAEPGTYVATLKFADSSGVETVASFTLR